MDKQFHTFETVFRHEDGQTMSEYAVVLGLIVLGVIAAIGFLSVAVTGHLNSVATAIGGLLP